MLQKTRGGGWLIILSGPCFSSFPASFLFTISKPRERNQWLSRNACKMPVQDSVLSLIKFALSSNFNKIVSEKSHLNLPAHSLFLVVFYTYYQYIPLFCTQNLSFQLSWKSVSHVPILPYIPTFHIILLHHKHVIDSKDVFFSFQIPFYPHSILSV